MTVDKTKLRSALSVIAQDEQGFFFTGQFIDLVTEAQLRFADGSVSQQLASNLRFVRQDLWNVGAIILRLDWYKTLWNQEGFGDLWRWFAPCDIDLFHIEVRSAFDYVAKIVRLVSDSPGQVPDKSFRRLKNWVAKGNNASRVGKDLAEFVLCCDWFDDLRDTRDTLVHRGGFTLAFPEKKRILFQVYRGMGPKIRTSEVMYNENVVDFELYAGLYCGYLIAYLEELALQVQARSDLTAHPGRTKDYGFGLKILQGWINRFIAKSEESK
jgi:hypothetical protein